MSSGDRSRILVLKNDVTFFKNHSRILGPTKREIFIDKELFSSSNFFVQQLDDSEYLINRARRHQNIDSHQSKLHKLSKEDSGNCHEDYSEIEVTRCSPIKGLSCTPEVNYSCCLELPETFSDRTALSNYARSHSDSACSERKLYENCKVHKRDDIWKKKAVSRRHSCPSFCFKQLTSKTVKSLKKGDLLLECDSINETILKDINGERLKASCSLFRDKDGDLILVNRTNVAEFKEENNQIHLYPQKMTLYQSTVVLNLVNKIGCFIIYQCPSVEKAKLSGCMLSLTSESKEVLHYRINRLVSGDFVIEGDTKSFPTLSELVQYFSANRRHLARRLRTNIQKLTKHGDFTKLATSRYNIRRNQIVTKQNLLSCDGSSEYYIGTADDDFQEKQSKIKMKVLTDNASEALDDFVYEASLILTLNNTNLVSLIGVDLAERPYCLMTEHPSYGTLRSCLCDGIVSSASQRSLDSVCLQIMRSLQYLENKRFVVHRKLSTSSFYVTERHVVKLGDFDRARMTTDDEYVAEEDERVLVKYAAPEVLTKLLYNTKSDVWALGITLWEVYHRGAVPFPFVKARILIRELVQGRPPLPLEGCPSSIKNVILECFNKDFKKRPSVHQLLRIFERQIARDSAKEENSKAPRSIRNRTHSFSSFSSLKQGKDVINRFLGKNVFNGSTSSSSSSPTFYTPTTTRKKSLGLAGLKFRQLTASSKEALLRVGGAGDDSGRNNRKNDLKPPSGRKV